MDVKCLPDDPAQAAARTMRTLPPISGSYCSSRTTTFRSLLEARLPSGTTTDPARQGLEGAADSELEPAVVAGAFLT